MRHIYLIARREYLSYVGTWRFWLSLAMIPVFLLVGAGLPVLMERASPTRNFTVIDADGRYRAAIARNLNADAEEQVRAILKGLEKTGLSPDLVKQARSELDKGASPEQVAELLGPQGRTAIAAMKQSFRMVPPPAKTPDELRPYLLGKKEITLLGKPAKLSAAVFIHREPDGEVKVQKWSTNVTGQKLERLLRRAISQQMQVDGFEKAGVNVALVKSISSRKPVIHELSPEKAKGDAEVTAADRYPYIMAVMFAFVLWSVVFSVAGMLLTSVIEEKSNKILDSLLSTVPLRSILLGKLSGVAAVSFTLLAGWALAGFVVTTLAGSVAGASVGKMSGLMHAAMQPGLLLPFFGYFIFGYLMFGSLYLALGSLCETMQEAQSLMSPMIFLMMIPMFSLTVALQDPQSPILAILSWIPIFTPYIMMARLPTDPPLWQILGTSALMIVMTWLILNMAARLFREGAMNQAGSDFFKKWFKRRFKRA